MVRVKIEGEQVHIHTDGGSEEVSHSASQDVGFFSCGISYGNSFGSVCLTLNYDFDGHLQTDIIVYLEIILES